MLEGRLSQGLPVNGAALEMGVGFGGSRVFGIQNKVSTGLEIFRNDGFTVLESQTVGDFVRLRLMTPVVRFSANAQEGVHLSIRGGAVAATPPGANAGVSSALLDTRLSFDTAGPAFMLPAGVTANAGTWLVNNRFIPTPIPEPGTWALLVAGMLAIGWRLRRAG